jgi:membrane-associated protease RseP (regulator of RpoE activity)
MSDPTLTSPPLYEIHNMPGMVVVSRPKQRYWLHALLLVATIFTTLVVGSRLQFNFDHNLPAFASEDDLFPITWALQNPARLLHGVPFSATLMLILLAHEMGHYFYCLRYRVFATLPFFIPAPTLIGTLGAFIRIKAPIRSRRALFDIGIAGPIAGFAVAVPFLVLALGLSRIAPPGMADSEIQFSYPLIFHIVHWFMPNLANVSLDAMQLHPMVLAAWVGMFATALNLLPGGQLDGGHIVYALWPRAHRYVSRITVVALLAGVVMWAGWAIWALLLMFSGMRHPQVGPAFAHTFTGYPYEDPWPDLGAKRRLLAWFALFMLIVTFMPSPFPGYGFSGVMGR